MSGNNNNQPPYPNPNMGGGSQEKAYDPYSTAQGSAAPPPAYSFYSGQGGYNAGNIPPPPPGYPTCVFNPVQHGSPIRSPALFATFLLLTAHWLYTRISSCHDPACLHVERPFLCLDAMLYGAMT
jgi:hypothetical protein